MLQCNGESNGKPLDCKISPKNNHYATEQTNHGSDPWHTLNNERVQKKSGKQKLRHGT